MGFGGLGFREFAQGFEFLGLEFFGWQGFRCQFEGCQERTWSTEGFLKGLTLQAGSGQLVEQLVGHCLQDLLARNHAAEGKQLCPITRLWAASDGAGAPVRLPVFHRKKHLLIHAPLWEPHSFRFHCELTQGRTSLRLPSGFSLSP